MTTLNQYQVYCETEAKNVTVWSEVPPTVCPNNNTDTIDPNSITIINTISSNEVTIKEDDSATPGYYLIQGNNWDIPAGPGLTSYNISFPYDIVIFSVVVQQSADNVGDTMDIVAAPNTVVGNITSNVAVGDTVINVSVTVIQNVQAGFILSLSDGTNTQKLGQIISIDSVNNKVTMVSASQFAFAAATPTLVMMEIPRVLGHYMNVPGLCILGIKKIGGTSIPANTIFTIRYTNNSTSAKKLVLTTELLY